MANRPRALRAEQIAERTARAVDSAGPPVPFSDLARARVVAQGSRGLDVGS
jgi:hypothetical protein